MLIYMDLQKFKMSIFKSNQFDFFENFKLINCSLCEISLITFNDKSCPLTLKMS